MRQALNRQDAKDAKKYRGGRNDMPFFPFSYLGVLGVLAVLNVPCRWFRRRLMWKLTLSHFITVFIAIAVVLVLNLAVVSGHLTVPGINIGKQIGEESIGRQAQAFALALSSEDATQPALLSSQFRRFVTIAYVGNSSLATGHILIVDKQGVLIDQVNSTLPIGAPVNDPEAPEMSQLVQNALAGETNLSSEKLYAFHASTGVYVGAYPIMDSAHHPVGAILLRTARQESFFRLLVRSLPNLLGTSLMAGLLVWVPVVVIALVVSVLLSRTLTRRLRRLQRAAGEIAAGNLDQCVPVTSIDEVGQLAEQFNRMAAQVREATEKQRAFVANASHDLRTPIAVVQGHLDGLLAHRDAHHFDADTVRTLTTMDRQARNLNRLVDDMLAVATLDEAAQRLHMGPVPVAPLVTEVVDTLREVARTQRKVALTTRLPPDLPPVEADRERLRQALTNLVQNALRYTPAGGAVLVSAEQQGDRIALAVTDTGIGIAPEDLPHVFERFYRTDRARGRDTGGTGLGLAIVKGAVDAMGGQITVESRVGSGSRFTITLASGQRAAGSRQ
jgi:two-component system, OmpR family, sensor histidine kinase BaeS